MISTQIVVQDDASTHDQPESALRVRPARDGWYVEPHLQWVESTLHIFPHRCLLH
jgi:hypothetical protein